VKNLRCREIRSADVAGVVEVFGRAFPPRDPARWRRVFTRLEELRPVPGMPRFGYLLEADDRPVGALLIIYRAATAGPATPVRGTMSAWCADPPYRAYASLLAAPALARPDVQHLNVTAARHTWPILEAQGFRRFAGRQFIAVAGLRPGPRGNRVLPVTTDLRPNAALPASECELLIDHLRVGCICITCTAAEGQHPFVFTPRRKYGCVPYAQLIYCRHVDEFARFAGPLGRYLARRGLPLVFLDAARRLPGVAGRFAETWPKFFKGPGVPRLGDLAYTDRALFGF
jgi:hypothetical protein